MPATVSNSIDAYELSLRDALEEFTPEQRLALATGMAERWLPVYEAFSTKEQWGDGKALRRMLDALWGQVLGVRITSGDVNRYLEQLKDSTPHMDDFDAEEALAACMMLSDALDCCRKDGDADRAIRAMLSGFEAVMPDWDLDPEVQPRLWKKNEIRRELKKQQKLLEIIRETKTFTEPTIRQLRTMLIKPDLVGETTPDEEGGTPAGISNQTAFEQYRRMVEADIRHPTTMTDDLLKIPGLFATMMYAQWGNRYRRRMYTLNGEYGKLADTLAQKALMIRSQAHDAVFTEMPAWDKETTEHIGLCISNPINGLDVQSLDLPHGYGPSMRQIWALAKQQGKSDADAWQSFVDWAYHTSDAWSEEDRRKKKGLSYSSPELGDFIGRTIDWESTTNPDFPWFAEIDSKNWQVRLNDFPDDVMYSLVIDGMMIGSFHDWPGTWHRD